MELDPRRLLVLHAIAEADGIAAAARLLGHTPSAVSQQLQRLEQEVGAALVDRGGGRLELTELGRSLADSGRQIERVLADAADRIAGLGSRASGPVRIGISAWGVGEIAIPAVRLLTAAQPDLEPVIVEADQPDGFDALRRGTLDLLVITDDRETALPLPTGVVAQLMNDDDYRIVVPESWPQPESPADLDGRPWVLGPEHTAGVRAFARFSALHGVTPSVRHQARQPAAIRTLVAGGLGAAVLPTFVAARLTGAVAAPFEVPGRCIVRLLTRTGPGGPSPAARAARSAIRQAAFEAVLRYAESGLAPREPEIRARLLDPSEEPGGSPTR